MVQQNGLKCQGVGWGGDNTFNPIIHPSWSSLHPADAVNKSCCILRRVKWLSTCVKDNLQRWYETRIAACKAFTNLYLFWKVWKRIIRGTFNVSHTLASFMLICDLLDWQFIFTEIKSRRLIVALCGVTAAVKNVTGISGPLIWLNWGVSLNNKFTSSCPATVVSLAIVLVQLSCCSATFYNLTIKQKKRHRRWTDDVLPSILLLQ